MTGVLICRPCEDKNTHRAKEGPVKMEAEFREIQLQATGLQGFLGATRS
jgi:hypothetical protein